MITVGITVGARDTGVCLLTDCSSGWGYPFEFGVRVDPGSVLGALWDRQVAQLVDVEKVAAWAVPAEVAVDGVIAADHCVILGVWMLNQDTVVNGGFTGTGKFDNAFLTPFFLLFREGDVDIRLSFAV